MSDWKCGECGKEFETMAACSQHLRDTGHFTGDGPHFVDTISCNGCGKEFDSSASHWQHVEDCEEYQELLDQICDDCSSYPCCC